MAQGGKGPGDDDDADDDSDDDDDTSDGDSGGADDDGGQVGTQGTVGGPGGVAGNGAAGAGKLATGVSIGANTSAGIALVPVASGNEGEVVVSVQLHGAAMVTGYAMELGYDPSAVTLIGSTAPVGSVFDPSEAAPAPAVQEMLSPGEVLLADAYDPASGLVGDVTVVVLTFQTLDAGLPAQLEILSAAVADGDGLINTLVGATLADARTGPAEYVLERNIPNPFNPVTQIGYQIPETGHVSLTVYNMLGQKVRVLVSELQAAGSYRVTWDGRDGSGRDVSSGIYVLRMHANRYQRTMKMLLLK
jgi:hypothetical protein